VYSQETDDKLGDFLGYAHAINMDSQDLSLDELKTLNKERSKARRDHSNYDALLALGKRKKLAEERKQDKKDKQRAEQKRLRQSSKKDSKVVKLRQHRTSTSSKKHEPLELLPERIYTEPIKPQQPEPQPEETLPPTSDAQQQERDRLIISNRKSKLKRLW
jgi:putative transposase